MLRNIFELLQREWKSIKAKDQAGSLMLSGISISHSDVPTVPYLIQHETQALLDAPDPATREGIRDRVMLHVTICAGLRVSELVGLQLDDIALPSMSLRVHGKGRRERVIPLWKVTATALRA